MADLVQYLLDAGADVTRANASVRHAWCSCLLLCPLTPCLTASPHACMQGFTPFISACYASHLPALALLLAHKRMCRTRRAQEEGWVRGCWGQAMQRRTAAPL